MEELTKKHCVPCEGGVPPLSQEKIDEYLKQVPEWELAEEEGKKGKHKLIRRVFKFKDFKEAIAFVNKVADLAESEGHHPNIHIYYNRVRLELWTHAINGLFDNDFILAAKIAKFVQEQSD